MLDARDVRFNMSTSTRACSTDSVTLPSAGGVAFSEFGAVSVFIVIFILVVIGS